MIAAVTVGLYMGWHTPELTTPLMRLQGVAVWEILTFLLNALLFLLVGLQLPSVVDNLSGNSTGELLLWALLVSAVVVVVRLAWTSRWGRAARRWPSGWRGMGGHARLRVAGRGARDPAHIDAGPVFPDRPLIIFLAFGVILVTLVGQGLTLAR